MKYFIFTFLALILIGANAQFVANTQQLIVDIHNTLRSKIALGTYVAKGTTKPAATNMLKIKWDSNLATSAQNYANTCPTGHSLTAGIGENLYWRYSTLPFSNLNVYGAAASISWEQEFQQVGWTKTYLSLDDITNPEKIIGHATQMAWSTSGLIGCGVKNCGKAPNKPTFNVTTVVCHYKSPGNIINAQVYNPGETCSQCPTGTTCEVSTGLCV